MEVKHVRGGHHDRPASPSAPAFAELAERPYADVLIIGGGINGLATFRDLAMQGVDVALVERDDYVSGASAASSHMIHGGIRYLENGEFRLVQEAVSERNALLRHRPALRAAAADDDPDLLDVLRHPQRPAPLPAPRQRATHRERGALSSRSGLVLYDSFSRGGGRVPRHTFHGRRRSLAELPALNPGVKYTATYWDASLHDPERLAIDVLRDGRAAGGAPCRAPPTTPRPSASRAARVLRARHRDGRGVRRSRHPSSSTPRGPWTDLTNVVLGDPTRYMGGTKGSHIVLDNPELLEATGGRELFFENNDGRIVLIYPLKGRVLVGTTDLEHDMADPMVCTEDEVDYFIDLVGRCSPPIPRGSRPRSCTGSRASGPCPATATSPPASSPATTASRRTGSRAATPPC